MAVASEELAAHETALAAMSERAESAQQTWFRLSALAERVSATVRIASERAQHLDVETASTGGPDPDELEAEAERVAAAEQQLLAELAATRTRLDAARTELAERERHATEAEQAHLAAVQAEADRREGLARLAGQVETMRARVESIDDGVAKLSERIEEAAGRAQQAKAEFETVQGRVSELDQGEVGLDEHHDRTVTALRLADERVAELQAAERGAERQVASLHARIDALSVGLERKDGAAWLTENRSSAGIFGSVAKLVKVQSGYEAALAAVLGAAADALAADSFSAAADAVTALKQADGGRAAIVLSDWPAHEPAHAGRAARRRTLGPRPGRGAGAVARRAGRHAVRCRRGRRPERGDEVGRRSSRSCARSPATAIWWAPAGSSAGRTANRRRWRSPPKSPRRVRNSRLRSRMPASSARRCPGR